MCIPEYWNTFIEHVASSEFPHQGTLRILFVEKFRHENWELRNSSIADLLGLIENHEDRGDVEGAKNQVRANLNRIYRHFSSECNYEQQTGRFAILRRWLRENRYPQWLEEHCNETSPAPSSENIYIERPPIEQYFYEEALRPGAFIRIKAPQQMGKTLLINRVLTEMREEGYQTLVYDFGLEDSEVFETYRRFIRCFCTGITNELNLDDCLSECWSENLGCNQNVTNYFEQHILAQQNQPLVIVLRRLDCVFEHPSITSDFCKLLRAWHEYSRTDDRRGSIWQKISVVASHSTDVYGLFDINSSPLANIGVFFTLPEFNTEQVREFALSYGLELSEAQIDQLIDLIGGHLCLLRQAFEYLKKSSDSWESFLQIATTEASPFNEHLNTLLQILLANEELKQCFIQVINSKQSVFLPSVCRFKLQSMGLIRLQGNECSPRCSLYRQYFQRHLRNDD